MAAPTSRSAADPSLAAHRSPARSGMTLLAGRPTVGDARRPRRQLVGGGRAPGPAECRRAPATAPGLATQTEPPQVSLPLAQFRWHRTEVDQAVVQRGATAGQPGPTAWRVWAAELEWHGHRV